MPKADLSAPRPLRLSVVVLILLLHVAVALGLLRAFAPDLTNAVVRNVTSVLTVTVTTPEPAPEPAAKAAAAPRKAGPAGKKAKPREVTAPEPKIIVAQTPAPEVSSTGNEDSSGASDAGDGTGAGGSGSGQGGGGASKAQKISGNIDSARDYPREGRDLRIGDHVIIALTVGVDGRVKNCRVVRVARDPHAGNVTCVLATKRFRFRPATNADGEPIESIYGWKQRWFYPGKK